MTRLQVYADLEALSEAAAANLAALINQQVAAHARFTLALSGGSTPRRLYQRLAEQVSAIPWDRVHIFWGDERAVLPDHPDSNYRLAHEALLAKVPVPPANIHRMQAEAPDLESAAAEYEGRLKEYCAPLPGHWPQLDLALLGLGNDGHTASLFPGTPEADETVRRVTPTGVAPTEPHVRRLTLTLPTLNHAAQVIFLVSGAAKAPLLREILAGGAVAKRYPSARVQPLSGTMLWMLDEAAAGELDGLPNVTWSTGVGSLIRSGEL